MQQDDGMMHFKGNMATKLMRIKLCNREWPFLRLEYSCPIPTITLIVRYMIYEIDDA